MILNSEQNCTHHITFQQFITPNLIFPLSVGVVRRTRHHAGALDAPYKATAIVELTVAILTGVELVVRSGFCSSKVSCSDSKNDLSSITLKHHRSLVYWENKRL